MKSLNMCLVSYTVKTVSAFEKFKASFSNSHTETNSEFRKIISLCLVSRTVKKIVSAFEKSEHMFPH